MAKINFHFLDITPALTGRNALKQFIETLFEQEKTRLETLSYVFCSDEYLLKMNRDFLKHDFYTDVITFDLSSNKKEVVGEVYISLDRVRDNARTIGISFRNELHRVIFHGALHLCGYKDKTKADIVLMRSKEDQYLKAYLP